MNVRVALSFTEISARLKAASLPEVDLVIGIARGGVVPASLAAFHLGKPLRVMRVEYRDDDNRPLHDAPLLLSQPPLPAGPLRILLVDDVCVSGVTMQAARAALAGHQVVTMVCKGQGDIVLFPEVAECVAWPWNVEG